MKFKKSYIFTWSLVAFLSSCSSEFLDLKPISKATTANFYRNADDIKSAVNGVYNGLQMNGISKESYVFAEIASDNTYPVASGSVVDQDEFDRFYIRTTNPYILRRWNDSYAAIARANAVLGNIENVEISSELKARLIGETKFLRAFFYFNLVRTFGDVPLVLKEVKNDEEGYEYNRASSALVYQQIEKDLQDAQNNLPLNYSGGDIGRATKGAAKSLLGKVFLTQQKYTEAAQVLKEVIDSKVYTLLSNYKSVFDVANKNHSEAIFDIQFKAGSGGLGNNWPNAFAPQNSGNSVINFGGGGNNRPSLDLINSYELGDQRKDISLGTYYINAAGDTIKDPYVKKYYDVPLAAGDNSNNIPVIRYADVLLMYAECQNELSFQSSGLALDYLNMTRNRAGLASLDPINSQEDFRLAIEKERRAEFAFEGQRWYDLVRTGRAIQVLNSKKTDIGLISEINQNNLVCPIPQSQVDINKGVIIQNSGY